MAKCSKCGSPVCMCGSPNHYKSPLEFGFGAALGAAVGGSGSGIERLQSMLAQEAAASQSGAMPADPSLAAAGITPTPPPVTGGATDVKSNPFGDQKYQLTPVQMTYEPPTPANVKGSAKSVFSPQVQASAEAIYGTPLQRQMSVPGAAMFMKDIPEGSEGKGLRKLPDNVVEKMGYDAATKMVSPLRQHHPQYFTGGKEVTKKEFDSINKANKAKTWLGGGQGLIPDALTGGKPTRQYLNESKLFNPTTTKEKVADLNDTRMMNAYGGNSITGDTNNKMYKHLKEKKKKVRPNRIDRY